MDETLGARATFRHVHLKIIETYCKEPIDTEYLIPTKTR